MDLAIGKLVDISGRNFRGTAFAVSPTRALTAFHCVGERRSGIVSQKRVLLRFLTGQETMGRYVAGSPKADYAILALESPLGQDLKPLSLLININEKAGSPCFEGQSQTRVNGSRAFQCIGYPEVYEKRNLVNKPDIIAIGGEVRIEDSLLNGVPAIQLFSDEGAGGLSLQGMSGAPVLVHAGIGGKIKAAIGLVRWNPPQRSDPQKSDAGIVFACPVKLIIDEHRDELGPVVIIRPEFSQSVSGEVGRRQQDFEPDMIPIPAGRFLMGRNITEGISENESPQHEVFLPDFCISRFPITHILYQQFIRKNKDYPPPEHWFLRKPPKELLEHPIFGVNWLDAMAYCEWLSKQTNRCYRLPSEAEWEKAASWTLDGHKRLYPWGNHWVSGLCNTGAEGTTAVSMHSKGASAYKVEDLLGNVLEWTRSLWGCDPTKPEFIYPYDPEDVEREVYRTEERPPLTRFVQRGGSYNSTEDEVSNTRRDNADPTSQVNWFGFRVVSIKVNRSN